MAVEEEKEGDVIERRIARRQAGVSAVKRTPAYIIVLCHNVPRAPSPDPNDMSLSKRAWERRMKDWRRDLRAALKRLHMAVLR